MVMRKIKLNRGKLANLPQLELGEPAVATDDGSLHIGTEQGNVKLAKDADVQAVSQQLADKSQEIQSLDAAKMDKNTTNISPTQINKNLAKFDQTYMADSLLQQIAGTAPVNATPADGGVTRAKLADGVVDELKLDAAVVNKTNNANAFVMGEVTNIQQAGNFTTKITTASEIFVSDAQGRLWKFNKLTDFDIPANSYIYADLTLAPNNVEYYDVKVGTPYTGYRSNNKHILLLSHYYGRYTGAMLKDSKYTLDSINTLKSDVITLRNDLEGIEIPTDIEAEPPYTVTTNPSGTVDITWKSVGKSFGVQLYRLQSQTTKMDMYHLYNPRILNDDGSQAALIGPIVMEWEGVVRETGAPDYSGGAHGQELQRSALLMIDNIIRPFTPETSTTFKADNIKLIVLSDVYSHLTGEVIATREKVIEFLPDKKFTIHNEYTWQKAVTLQYSYLGMASLYRENNGVPLSQNGMMDNKYIPENATVRANAPNIDTYAAGVEKTWHWSDVFSLEMSFKAKNPDPTERTKINLDDASGINKSYYMYAQNKTVAVGDVWEGLSEYVMTAR